MNVSNTDAIINVQGLNKAYGRNKIFQNLDLVINYGEVCALIGINGSGKTTLLKILSTLTKPDSGALSISGLTSTKNGEDIRKLPDVSADHFQFIRNRHHPLDFHSEESQFPAEIRRIGILHFPGQNLISD